MRALAVIVGALLSLVLARARRTACVCVRTHPAMRLPSADGRDRRHRRDRAPTGADSSITYVIRVERAVKGD